ncbi:hypothetical protein Taro_050730 [Colocasia esculenta]|uniref:Exopolygalacturonase n=1 Tax=Colocasia esculenta TaxID=4460 RepID=A0A843XE50_COLES|nr:hypothetical protein [Colocasia esculenta]
MHVRIYNLTFGSQAFLAAWDAACSCGKNATMVIPAGTFVLGPVLFKGPCSNAFSPALEIKGTLKALPNFTGWAWIEFHTLHELAVGGGGTLDGQGSQCWGQGHNLPTTLKFQHVNDGTVSNLSLVDSKGFHVVFHSSTSVTACGLNITAPAHSPNTDGIHLSNSSHINITDCRISTGDDCISVGPGIANVSISGIFCGPGHGLSVGSLGKYADEKAVMGLTVRNCTITQTTNGVRIKTWPGSPVGIARNITFEDIVMNNVSNPIIIDQDYCPQKSCSSEPSLVQITGVRFRNVQGTSSTAVAVKLQCSPTKPCDGLHLENINLKLMNGAAAISECFHAVGMFGGIQNPSPCL